MLDLGKPLGTFEGLVFYGDHELDNLVYYFPDQVNFSCIAGSNDPELNLLMFQKEEVIVGGEENIEDSIGGILQVGAVCTVEKSRLDQALKQLREKLGLPENVSATTPPWKDGSVDMIVLDSSKSQQGDDSSFVQKFIGSTRPSLATSDLKCVFNVRLDRMGAQMLHSTMTGQRGSVAGILYDLQYVALRPSVDLKITADLERCHKTASHELGIDFDMVYEGVEFAADANLQFITTKMVENGDIKIKHNIYTEDPQEKQLAKELIEDFKSNIIKELFEVRQYKSPEAATPVNFNLDLGNIANLIGKGGNAEDSKPTGGSAAKGDASIKTAAGDNNGKGDAGIETAAGDTKGEGSEATEDGGGLQMPMKIGVSYKFRLEKITENRVIEVDYNEASAVVRSHTPQSHLWTMAQGVGQDMSKCITWSRDSVLKKQQTRIRLSYDFTLPESDLVLAEVRLWRAEDGLDAGKNVIGFRSPASAHILYSDVLSKDSSAGDAPLIQWTVRDDEKVGFYYQLRFVFKKMDNVISPSEIFTEPVLSYSRDILIIPDTMVYYRKYQVTSRGLDWDLLKSADVDVEFLSPNAIIGHEKVFLSQESNGSQLIIRGKDSNPISVLVSTSYLFKDGTTVTANPVYVYDDEVCVIHPTHEKQILVRYSRPGDGVMEISLEFTVQSPAHKTKLYKQFSLESFEKQSVLINVPVFSEQDTISYCAYVYSDQSGPEGLFVASDSFGAEGNLKISLDISDSRPLWFKWSGPAPKSLNLKYLSVVLKDQHGMILKDENGEEIVHVFEQGESWQATVPRIGGSIMVDIRKKALGRSEEVVVSNYVIASDELTISARPPYIV